MTRKEFVRLCGILGISLPLAPSVLASEINKKVLTSPFKGKVIIIGAGAAGLSSAYLLAQNGIDFEIIEASSQYGGRIRHNKEFTDFPISLGGEWLHSDPDELKAIVNDAAIEVTTQMQAYSDDDVYGYYEDETYKEFTSRDFGGDEDLKFKGTSWLGFFEDYIIPKIRNKIVLNTPVKAINYEKTKIEITCANSQTYEADKVIVTVPVQILKDNDIQFVPPLSPKKIKALKSSRVWGGMKVFLEFSEQFYPTFIGFPDSESKAGQRLYYDAAYGQKTNAHILGLFSVGKQAEPYQKCSSEEELRDYILKELDVMYDGAATKYYVKHISQNWSKEPFVRQAYLADKARPKTSRVLSKPIDDKVYFAGDAYTSINDWSAVHVAVKSAKDAVSTILEV